MCPDSMHRHQRAESIAGRQWRYSHAPHIYDQERTLLKPGGSLCPFYSIRKRAEDSLARDRLSASQPKKTGIVAVVLIVFRGFVDEILHCAVQLFEVPDGHDRCGCVFEFQVSEKRLIVGAKCPLLGDIDSRVHTDRTIVITRYQITRVRTECDGLDSGSRSVGRNGALINRRLEGKAPFGVSIRPGYERRSGALQILHPGLAVQSIQDGVSVILTELTPRQ